MKFQKAYDRPKCSLSFLDEEGNPLPSMTQQHMKQETDINHIIKKYDKTGLITHVNNAVAQYGDFTQANEYQEALNRVINAQNSFHALPAEIRKRFFNDPGEFFEFATDPANAEEMYHMGLAEAPQSILDAEQAKHDALKAAEGGQAS